MFDTLTIQIVWNKGIPIPSYDANMWRRDKFGLAIKRDAYGECSQFGWEIDHLVPVVGGGTDHIGNLRPLHWSCNRQKGSKLSLADFLTG